MIQTMKSRETFRYEGKQKKNLIADGKKNIISANKNIWPDKTYDRIEK